jgi:regulator of protease activity HflC (stomatin/prohibitin superfamily)
MGAVTGTLQPGPHFVTPFITSVDEVSVKTLQVSPNEDASSQDLQQVHTQVTLTYHFNSDNDSIIYIYSKLIDNSPNAVENKVVNPAIYEAIKATTAKYTVQDLVQKRAQVRDDIESMVKARLAPYHITAETTSITDFRFSETFEKSIEAKQVAQQDAEKANNVLAQKRVEAEQAKVDAEGAANAAAAEANGKARAILAVADAQAKANKELAASLTQALILNKAIEKWNGQRPMVEGGKGSGLLLQLPAVSGNAPDKDDQ